VGQVAPCLQAAGWPDLDGWKLGFKLSVAAVQVGEVVGAVAGVRLQPWEVQRGAVAAGGGVCGVIEDQPLLRAVQRRRCGRRVTCRGARRKEAGWDGGEGAGRVSEKPARSLRLTGGGGGGNEA
jgi:hypothetical protein